MSRISETDIIGEGDEHDKMLAWVNANAGGVLEFDVPETREYVIDRIDIPAGTRIITHAGISFRRRPGGIGVFRFNGAKGVRFFANGATVYGESAAGFENAPSSHTVSFLGAEDCKTFGLNIDGASTWGGGKDCVYIGAGEGANNGAPCKNVQLFNGKYFRGKRNNISVVAGVNTVIDGFEAAYSTGAPGCGIDVEANKYEMVGYTAIRNGKAHSNQNSGVVNVFGVRTTLDNVDLYGNGKYGFGIGSGGTQFDEAVYRPHVDMLGIFGFNQSTGGVFVSELPEIGTPVNFSVRNGAKVPPQFVGYYVVSRIIGPNEIILGKSVGNSEVTALSLPGAGVMCADPYESDIRLRAFVAGQSDRCELLRSRIHSNGTQGLFVGGAGNFFGYDSDIYANGSNQIQVQYTRDVELRNIRTRGDGSGIAGIVGSGGGGYLRVMDSSAEQIRGRGMAFAEWTNAELDNNKTIDCAEFEAGSIKAGLSLSSMLAPKITRHRATQRADNTRTLFGIHADAAVKNGEFIGNDCTGAGTTNANSFWVASTTNLRRNNKRKDGSVI